MNLNLNVRALRLSYSQFFVNINEIDDESLLSIHFRYVDQIDEDETYLQGNIPIFEELVVFQPFEDMLPMTILDLILDLYADLVSEYKLEDPNTIVINKADVVMTLARDAVEANERTIEDPQYIEFIDYYSDVLENAAL